MGEGFGTGVGRWKTIYFLLLLNSIFILYLEVFNIHIVKEKKPVRNGLGNDCISIEIIILCLASTLPHPAFTFDSVFSPDPKSNNPFLDSQIFIYPSIRGDSAGNSLKTHPHFIGENYLPTGSHSSDFVKPMS